MTPNNLLQLLLLVQVVSLLPVSQTSVHVRFSSKPISYSHSTLDISSAYKGSIESNPENLWPNGVFLQPDDEMLTLLTERTEHQNMYHDFVSTDEDPDPLLISGAEAVAMVKFIFSKGPLFYEDVPHARALLRNQKLRLANGLDGNLLGSIRPDSVFYRWKHLHGNHQQSYYTLPFFAL